MAELTVLVHDSDHVRWGGRLHSNLTVICMWAATMTRRCGQ